MYSFSDEKYTDKDIIKDRTFPYFQSDCFALCERQKYFEVCNKTELFLENLQYYFTNNNYFNSNLSMFTICDFNIWYGILNKFQKEGPNEICEDQCPIECNTISYDINVIASYNPNDYKNNVSKVDIYYDDFSYTSITDQQKITSDSLFGAVGGLLGLFLGASLMSAFEFVDIAFHLIAIIFQRK